MFFLYSEMIRSKKYDVFKVIKNTAKSRIGKFSLLLIQQGWTNHAVLLG